ncbi:hypothetical protein B0H14DRAFT_126195 [Mycena olivaceomarginata]|nr:hypothetical protein B0H14DRAFT_126195 [Mycena olivaceomarginata]
MTLCLECKERVTRRHVGRQDLTKRTTCRGGRTTSTCEFSRVSISDVEVPRAACNIPKGNGSALSERVTGRHGVRHSVRHSVRPAREGEPREIMRLGGRVYMHCSSSWSSAQYSQSISSSGPISSVVRIPHPDSRNGRAAQHPRASRSSPRPQHEVPDRPRNRPFRDRGASGREWVLIFVHAVWNCDKNKLRGSQS